MAELHVVNHLVLCQGGSALVDGARTIPLPPADRHRNGIRRAWVAYDAPGGRPLGISFSSADAATEDARRARGTAPPP